MKGVLYILLLIIWICGRLQAEPGDFQQGLRLFQQKQYIQAQRYFTMCDEASSDGWVQYYLATCAVQLKEPQAEEQFLEFTKKYPDHPKSRSAYYQLGNLYFLQQAFAKSIECYARLDLTQMHEEHRYEVLYRLAYSHMCEKHWVDARRYFDQIKSEPGPYQYASCYYAGYIALQQCDYGIARDNLQQAEKHDEYRTVVQYLIAQIYYRQQQYKELIEYVDRFKGIALTNHEEIILMTAEAYFFTQQYQSAAQHYGMYTALQTASRDVQYRAAYSLYESTENKNTLLTQFQCLCNQLDEVGARSSYYIGLIHLKAKRLQQALAAFIQAQQHTSVQEYALIEGARIQCALGRYRDAIDALKVLQKNYPNSLRTPEVSTLMSQAYLNTNDYDLAIAYIKSLPHRSKEVSGVYQKVLFYRGCAYVNEGDYLTALDYFKKAQSPDPGYALKAQCWIGTCYSALQRDQEAIKILTPMLPGSSQDIQLQATYVLAHIYFQQGDAVKALPLFDSYCRNTQALYSKEATIRLADCCYVIKDYKRALSLYTNSPETPHTALYCAQIERATGQTDRAKKRFETLVNIYGYQDTSLMALSDMAREEASYETSIQYLTQLIKQCPRSPLIPEALSYRAMAYQKQSQHDLAVEDYSKLLQQYPTHERSSSALRTLLQYDLEQYQNLREIIQTYQDQHVSPDNLEALLMDTVRELVYSKSYDKAQKKLNYFLERFPDSTRVPEAHFLYGEISINNPSEALIHYMHALQLPGGSLRNKVLFRLGEIHLAQKKFEQALEYYTQLLADATSDKEVYQGRSGIISAGYALKKYGAVHEQITQLDTTMHGARTRPLLLLAGKSKLEQNDFEAALKYFNTITQDADDVLAAEAQYWVALVQYKTKYYEKSLETLFALHKICSCHIEWVNKGFLLIADNYIAQRSYMQAVATLQSISDRAEDKEIVERAQNRLRMVMKILALKSKGLKELATDNKKLKEPATNNKFRIIDGD